MFANQRIYRDLISEAIRKVIDGECARHYPSLTQEHQLTSRIAGAIETALGGSRFGGYSLDILAQELPDRGRGALEREAGADLYVGVELISESEHISKGLFIQAKWRDARRDKRLLDQCKRMSSRSNASYLWLYGRHGVRVVPASEVCGHPADPPEVLGSRNIYQLFQQVFDCFEGDARYGLPDVTDKRQALGSMLREFAIRSGVAVSIIAPDASG